MIEEDAMAPPLTVSPDSSLTIPTNELAVISVNAIITYTSAIHTNIIKRIHTNSSMMAESFRLITHQPKPQEICSVEIPIGEDLFGFL